MSEQVRRVPDRQMSRLQRFFQLLAGRVGEPEGDGLSQDHDRPAHACSVLGQPAEQLLASQALGLCPPLGCDQVVGASHARGQDAQLVRTERLLDQVP